MATKTTAKKEVETEEDVIDVSQFFSMENEENGIWFEASVNKYPTGIEFKVYGPNSKKVWVSGKKYTKALEELEDEANDEKKHDKENELLIQAVVERICGIRGKDGKKIKLKGKDITLEDVPTLLLNSPAMAISVWNFCQKGDNFLEMKKKN